MSSYKYSPTSPSYTPVVAPVVGDVPAPPPTVDDTFASEPEDNFAPEEEEVVRGQRSRGITISASLRSHRRVLGKRTRGLADQLLDIQKDIGCYQSSIEKETTRLEYKRRKLEDDLITIRCNETGIETARRHLERKLVERADLMCAIDALEDESNQL